VGILKSDDLFVQAVRACIERLAVPIALVEFQGLEDALTASPDGAILLPARMPLEQMFAGAQSAAAPDQDLDSWRHEAELLLGLCRKARRRIVLVDTLALATNPTGCGLAIAERLGLSDRDTPANLAETVPFTALHRVLAAGLVAATPRAQTLAEELSAMITGPTTFMEPTQQEFVIAAQELAAMVAEQDSLNAALEQTRDMLEAAEAKANDLAKNVSALEKEHDAAKALEAQLEASEEARDRL